MSEREQKLVQEVLGLHEDIRFCGIINTEGQSVTSAMKEGVESLEPESHFPKLALQLALLRGTDMDWNEYLGETRYFWIHKSKVNLLLYPMKGMQALLVSTSPTLTIDKLDGVRKAVERYEKMQLG
jgi:hypothetical protein